MLTRTPEDAKSGKYKPSAEEAATVALCAARERGLSLTGPAPGLLKQLLRNVLETALNERTRERGNEGTRERGNEGTRE